MSYINPNAYEPSFREGNDLLHATGSFSRPAIPTKGGFVPSVMGNLVQNGAVLVPLATVAAHRMLANTRKTRKQRGGSATKHGGSATKHGGVKDWETLRDEAKRDLTLIGKASAININRLASIRKRGESNAEFIEDFTARKGSAAAPVAAAAPKPAPKRAPAPVAAAAPAPVAKDKVSTWQENKKRAKNFLTRIGKPTGPNIASYASMMRKGLNTKAFLDEFQSRVPKVKAPKAPAAAAAAPKAPAAAPNEQTFIPLSERIKRPIREKKPVVPVYVPSPALLPPAIKTQKAPRKEGAKGVAWKENKERAKEFLSQYGKPRGANITRFASIRRTGDATAESEFLSSFRSRPPPATKSTRAPRIVQSESKEEESKEEEWAPRQREESKEEESKEEEWAPRQREESKEESKEEELLPPPVKEKKPRAKTDSTEQWRLNRERAKELLGRIGSATAAEISKLASMMRGNVNTSAFLESVRSRVNATRKRLTMLKQKKEKQLSAVPENVNENEAEPYAISSLSNSSNNSVVEVSSASNYQPPAFVAPKPTMTRKAPNLENFRKHLQFLKQNLQREKV